MILWRGDIKLAHSKVRCCETSRRWLTHEEAGREVGRLPTRVKDYTTAVQQIHSPWLCLPF